MQNLSLHDQPPGGPSLGQAQGHLSGPNLGGPPGMPPVAQLPPQMFTTAASLLDLTDKKLMVALRDGRKITGVLRSWDQFGNLVLQDSVERTYASTSSSYADEAKGVYLVRGENVLLMGEIDLDKDDHVPPPYEPGNPEEVFAANKVESAKERGREARRIKRLKGLGFEVEHSGEAIL